MYAYNLRLNVDYTIWKNSKLFYSSERQKYIDSYRDGCTRNPCCRKNNSYLSDDDSSWPLPVFFIWANGIYINHLLCFEKEIEAYHWLLQWITEEKKKFCGKWNFPKIHVYNVFGKDVSSFLHPVYDDGEFVEKISNGLIVEGKNFWNGYTMKTYKKHDLFNGSQDYSVDLMDHWSDELALWVNGYIEKFYDKKFPSYWEVDLVHE